MSFSILHIRDVIQYFSFSHPLHLSWQSLGHSCCCKWHYFILFDGCVISQCIYGPHFIYSFLCQWTFRLPPCLPIVNSVAMNTGVCVSFWIMFWSGHMPRSRIAKSQVGPVLVFFRNLHTVLHSGCSTQLICFLLPMPRMVLS